VVETKKTKKKTSETREKTTKTSARISQYDSETTTTKKKKKKKKTKPAGGIFAHAGMVHSAVELRRELIRDGLLHSFVNDHAMYNIVVTGHSLVRLAAND
jgi:hypothetical protein